MRFYRAIDEPYDCVLLLSPLKGGSKREFLHIFLRCLSCLRTHFKFGTGMSIAD